MKCSCLSQEFYNNCIKLGLNYKVKNNIWVGFSGGLDSSVLLYLSYLTFANNPNYNLNAVYINHQINKNADCWEQHCQTVCKNLNINFRAIKITINSKQIKTFGLEAALRISRNEVWKKLLAPKDLLFLAHHLNDQAETILLRLLRGSGVRGLSSIQPISNFEQFKIMRPLLDCTRQELEYFAKEHKLSYIIDDSNYDHKFARNFLRHEIFPKLFTKWPQLINNFGRAANHLQQVNKFIKSQANAALSKCYKNINIKNILIISRLLKYDQFLQTEILRMFITTQGFNPPNERQLNQIYTEVIYAKIDRQPKLNLRQYLIYRYRDELYLYSPEYLQNYYFNQKKFSFMTRINDLEIYFGDKINQINLINSDKIKKIFQKLGIPPWQRKNYPLVFKQGKLVAILGLWFSKEK